MEEENEAWLLHFNERRGFFIFLMYGLCYNVWMKRLLCLSANAWRDNRATSVHTFHFGFHPVCFLVFTNWSLQLQTSLFKWATKCWLIQTCTNFLQLCWHYYHAVLSKSLSRRRWCKFASAVSEAKLFVRMWPVPLICCWLSSDFNLNFHHVLLCLTPSFQEGFQCAKFPANGAEQVLIW